MNKIYAITLVSLIMTGCVSFQPSTYSNRSNASGNIVNATGNAAAAAASANRSYNCPSCIGNLVGKQGLYPGSYSGAGYSQANHVERITNSATQALSTSISNVINREIYKVFSY